MRLWQEGELPSTEAIGSAATAAATAMFRKVSWPAQAKIRHLNGSPLAVQVPIANQQSAPAAPLPDKAKVRLRVGISSRAES